MKHTVKVFVALLAVGLLLALLPAFASATTASGSYGDYVTWNLNSSGNLTITGTGAGTMTDQSNVSGYPWYAYRSEITSVSLSGIDRVPKYAFDHYPELKSVYINSALCTAINDHAFDSCEKLTTVERSEATASLTTIGVEAFDECHVLGALQVRMKSGKKFFDNVTSIGNYAFYKCYKLNSFSYLSSVYYSNGVLELPSAESIGSYAFRSCEGIKELNMPRLNRKARTVGAGAFSHCINLEKINIGGQLYGDETTVLGENAFYNCSSLPSAHLEAVTIPDSAFNSCGALKYLELSECTIGENAVPADMPIIYHYERNIAQNYIYSPYLLGENFHYNNIIEYGYFWASGDTQGDKYFCIKGDPGRYLPEDYDFSSIVPYIVSLGNIDYYIEHIIVEGAVLPARFCINATMKEGLTPLDLSSEEIAGFSGYGEMAFRNSNILKPDTVIPDTVTSIGSQAFYKCDNLTSLTIPGSVETIPYGMAANCANLATVTVGEGVKELDSRCFSFDPSLEAVYLPSTIEYIGLNAFSGASNNLTIYYNGTAAQWAAIGGKASQWTPNVVFAVPETEELQAASVTLSWTSKPYNGSVQKPTVTVKNAAGATLTAGIDYTVTWPNDSKLPDTYTVTVTGMGGYSGAVSKDYTITKQALTAAGVTLSWTTKDYNGSVQKPTVTVKNAQGSTLTLNTSYTLEWSGECKEADTYTVTVKGKGNYSGSVPKTFTIVDTSKEALSAARITLSWASKPYNAAVQKPTVTVKNAAGTTLTLNRSYTLTWSAESKLPNTYKVTVSGMGNYRGDVEKSYTITKQTLADAGVTLSWTTKEYNGAAQKPTVTVKNAQGSKLTLNTSYEVTWPTGCKYPNAYSVTIKGKGNYEGSVTKSFTITKQTLTAANVTLNPTSFTYNGQVQKPTVTVTAAQGTVLSEGGSYTVTWPSGCKAKGTYTVTIIGKGYYTGEFTVQYTIK